MQRMRTQCRTDVPKVLRQLLNLHQEISVKKEILSRLREMSQSMSAASFSHVPGSKNKYSRRSKTENSAVKILSAEENLMQDIKELSALTEKFSSVLDNIDDIRYKELLTYRYICGDTWEQIAEKMDYSYIHVANRLHPQAVRILNGFDL